MEENLTKEQLEQEDEENLKSSCSYIRTIHSD